MKALTDIGQHFLTDASIAAQMVEDARPISGEHVWEIGPGTGILTRELIKSGMKVTAFEIDRRMQPLLQKEFGDQLELIMRDVLRIKWQDELSKFHKIKIIANIPYQITSPLLYRIEEFSDYLELAVLMIQKEVAQRLAAIPGTKEYGVLTLRMRLKYDIEILRLVGKELFDPPPKVESAIIRITHRQNPPFIKDYTLFNKLVNQAFIHRRKTLRNNLKSLFGEDKTEALHLSSGIDFHRRGETLSETEFITLCDCAANLQ